jgi:ABC-type polysaccharide/polyol phosphate export permease
MTGIFCLVFHQVFHVSVREYAPFVLSGLACWGLITTVTLQGCQCFFFAESYIRQYPAPLAIYPLRTALGCTIHFLTALFVVLVLAVGLRGLPSWPCLFSLLPTIILLFLLGWSLALLAGFANVYFQDTQHLLEVGFQMLFYATPIMYQPRMLGDGRLAMLIRCNPIIAFLQIVRDPILEGHLAPLEVYAVAVGVVAITLTAAGVTLASLQRRLIFHL